MHMAPGYRHATVEEANRDRKKRYEAATAALEKGLISQKQYDSEMTQLNLFGGYGRPIEKPKRKPLGQPNLRASTPLRQSRTNQVIRALAKASRRWRSS